VPRSAGLVNAMNFGFLASLVVLMLAIVGVFANLPIVSPYAFWFAVLAYVILAGVSVK
jgi:hypothetical protein